MSSPDRDADQQRAAHFAPEAIAHATFPTGRRGFDTERVRSFLERVAGEMREARDREIALHAQIQSLEAKLAQQGSQLDEATLTTVLGEETARVLTAAREAAAGITTRASESAEAVVREAREAAASLRSEAEVVLATRTEEANTEASRIRAEAEEAVKAFRAAGERALEAVRVDADRLRVDAEEAAVAEIEAARERGREMVDEALLVRGRVLEDLARKRKASRVQIERLQAGRERLIESYAIVQRTLDEANEELRTSLSSAKLAADAAAWRAEAEPTQSVAELEREVEVARAEGFDRDEVVEVVDVEIVDVVDIVDVADIGDVAEMADGIDVDEMSDVDELTDDDGSVDVDELFARIRASRQEEVARAQDVLAADPEADDSEADFDADDNGPKVQSSESGEPQASAASEGEAPAEPDTEAAGGPDAGSAGAAGSAVDEHPAPAPDDQALLERRDAITDTAEKQAVRKLKRVLADEQNEVLDQLRRKPKSTLGDVFPAADDHAERYASVVRAHLVDVARRGGSFYGREPADTEIDDLAVELGQALTLPLRDRVEGSLRDGAGDDEAVADGVRAAYRDWKAHRVASQTRDTIISAFNRGLFQASDPGTEMRWLVDNGGSPCPDAEDNSLAGLVVRGEPFPTGHCYPPAHPGCRCLLVPAPH